MFTIMPFIITFFLEVTVTRLVLEESVNKHTLTTNEKKKMQQFFKRTSSHILYCGGVSSEVVALANNAPIQIKAHEMAGWAEETQRYTQKCANCFLPKVYFQILQLHK